MKMNKLLFACLFLQLWAFGQVGINIANPNSKAALEVVSPSTSDNRGVLLPRMSTAQMNTIATNATTVGLMVFNTDDRLFYYHDGSEWVGLVPKQPSLSYSADPSVNGHIVVDVGSIKAPKLNADTILSKRAVIDTLVNVNVPGFSHNALVPTGAIIMWSGSTPPTGWALCDGQSYYSNGVPFDPFGPAQPVWVTGPHPTPDLRGRFIVGAGQNLTPVAGDLNPTYVINQTGGSNQTVLTKDQLPKHFHSANSDGATINILSSGAHTHGYNAPAGGSSTEQFTGGTNNYGPEALTTGVSNHTHPNSSFSGNTGDGTSDGLNANPIDNRPPYYVLAYIIKLP